MVTFTGGSAINPIAVKKDFTQEDFKSSETFWNNLNKTIDADEKLKTIPEIKTLVDRCATILAAMEFTDSDEIDKLLLSEEQENKMKEFFDLKTYPTKGEIDLLKQNGINTIGDFKEKSIHKLIGASTFNTTINQKASSETFKLIQESDKDKVMAIFLPTSYNTKFKNNSATLGVNICPKNAPELLIQIYTGVLLNDPFYIALLTNIIAWNKEAFNALADNHPARPAIAANSRSQACAADLLTIVTAYNEELEKNFFEKGIRPKNSDEFQSMTVGFIDKTASDYMKGSIPVAPQQGVVYYTAAENSSSPILLAKPRNVGREFKAFATNMQNDLQQRFADEYQNTYAKAAKLINASKSKDSDEIQKEVLPILVNFLSESMNIKEEEAVNLLSPTTKFLSDISSQLKTAASAEQQSQYTNLLLNRAEKGFSQFITDLAGVNEKEKMKEFEIRERDDRKWKIRTTDLKGNQIKGGAFIELGADATEKDVTEVNAFMGRYLGDKPWFAKYDTTNQSKDVENSRPNVSKNTKKLQEKTSVLEKLKTLGKNGENKAVDPILFVIDKDGVIKVLAGKRPTSEYALPGGMNESTVKKTCRDEFLEETCGGSLFKDKESATSKIADKLRDESFLNFKKKFDLSISSFQTEVKYAKSGKIASIIEELRDKLILSGGKTTITDFLDEFEIKLQELVGKKEIQQADVGHYLIRLKCNLYEKLCPDEYQRFEKFIDSRLEVSSKQVVNQSDPRNTGHSYMTTIPVVGIMNEVELESEIKKFGLEFIAGDDLVGPGLKTLDEFLKNPYSDHASLILNALAEKIEKKEFIPTSDQLQQLTVLINNANLRAKSTEEKLQKYNQENTPKETVKPVVFSSSTDNVVRLIKEIETIYKAKDWKEMNLLKEAINNKSSDDNANIKDALKALNAKIREVENGDNTYIGRKIITLCSYLKVETNDIVSEAERNKKSDMKP